MQNVHFTPPQIARLFQVNVSTIKRWVDRGILESEKTPGGHRRITQAQLATFIKQYPKHANKSYAVKQLLQSRENTNSEHERYYSALQLNNWMQAESVLKEYFIIQGKLLPVIDSIILPTLRAIGTKWSEGEISVYEEHRMTFIIRENLLALKRLVHHAHSESEAKGKAVLACAEGDHHEISLQLLSLVLFEQNIETHVLGINVPDEELLRAIEEIEPNIICISRIYNNGADLQSYIEHVASYAKKEHISLYLGGGGWTTKEQDAIKKHSNVVYLQSVAQLAESIGD